MKVKKNTKDIKSLLIEYNEQAPRWAVDLNYLVAFAAVNQENCVNKRHQELNIKHTPLTVLNVILENGGKISQKLLSKKLPVSRQAIAIAVSNLEKKGLVTREKVVRDKRRRQIYLTDEGIEFMRFTLLFRKNFYSKLTNYISEDEAKNLIESLVKINEFYEKEIRS